jgi:hypothetical protein
MAAPQPGVGGELHRLVRQVQLTDQRVPQPLDAGPVELHVVAAPANRELLAAGGELADEVDQDPVVRGTPGLGAQERDGVVGALVPVDPEVGGGRVEEHEPRGVDRSALGEQRCTALTGGTVMLAAALLLVAVLIARPVHPRRTVPGDDAQPEVAADAPGAPALAETR